ncbi:cytochrome c oxidase subunit 3 [Thermoleptolyngbya sp.]
MDSSISTEKLDVAIAPPHAAHAHEEDHAGNSMFGFIVFLLSESVIFLSFFAGYILVKTTTPNWLPAGVSGLEVSKPAINTVVLVASSFVAYFAERALKKNNLLGFRLLWLLTMAMGIYFLVGQAIEWSELEFGFSDSVFGGMFYLLTGFHGLHVLTGVLLMGIMLAKSFVPNNYVGGHVGVDATSLFWHFVDVIWIVLFTLIYIWQ